jgi:DNA excision repair protein ERCC-5
MLAQQIGSNGNTDSNLVKKYTPSNPSILSAATTSTSATKPPINELETNFASEIETYRDEQGRVRVSRSRGLGIRMTRDIQRNLDFIKEYEQESNTGVDSAALKNGPLLEPNDLNTDISFPRNEEMEISFLEDPEEGKDSVDDIFLHLAAGVPSNKELVVSDDSEDIWEDGIVEENGAIGKEKDGKKENNVVWTENSSEGDAVDWEDGASELHATISSSQFEQTKRSKGVLEEEALVQEAIRRSLKESVIRENRVGKCDNNSQSKMAVPSKGVAEEEALVQEAIRRSLEESVIRETTVSTCDNEIGNSMSEEKDNDEEEVDWEEGSCHSPINTTISQPEEQDVLMPVSTDIVKSVQSSRSLVFDTDTTPVESRGNDKERPNEEKVVESTCNICDVPVNCKLSETNIKNLQGRAENSRSDEVSPEFVKQQQADAISDIKGPIASSDVGSISERGVHKLDSSDSTQFDRSSKGPVASSGPDFISERGVHEFHKTSDLNPSFLGLNDNNDVAKETTGINLVSDSTMMDTADENLMNDLNTISETNLQEEISLLRQEQAELGHQRRKLESHAEAVSSEMFAECQVVFCI